MSDAEAYEATCTVVPPRSGDGPLVVSVPHAGTRVPAEDRDVIAVEGRALLRDADLFCDRLAAAAPDLGAPLVVEHVSRYVLDVNRSPDDVDREAVLGLDLPARISPRGLIWRQSTDGTPILRRPLTLEELRGRIARIHAPYHAALASLLEERRRRFGYALLLDVHSMPSLGRPGHGDVGVRRADIVPGDVRATSCAPAVMHTVVEHFESHGWLVRPNDPYMGGFITRRHGRPEEGVHAIQLELNRDLYMDEETLAYDGPKAARVIPALHGLIEKLRALTLR